MKLPSSWIQKCLGRTMLNPSEMVKALERAGIEIEQVISSKEIDKRVVVALVKKVVRHPNADKLRLVIVTVGEKEYSIVCGAPNVREGQKVALAQIGAVLPSGDRIEKAKLRGEVSEGMLCSERELDLGQDHNGIMELSNDVAVGTMLCDMYPAETIIDMKTPANRFDLQSVTGLAREVAAMTTAELALPSSPPVTIAAGGPKISPKVRAHRYMLAHVKIDPLTPSPSEMVSHLRAAGIRSLGPVVDVTNYVMLEWGQPLHAFDAAKVKLPIDVRLARPGETLVTLDGTTRELTAEDLIIADQTGPIALAGLMGGASTEVDDQTSEILVEAAVFDAATVRKMAKRHGMRTEASARFERGLPVELPPLGLARALELLGALAGAQLVAASDQQNAKPVERQISLRAERASELLGFGITDKEIVSALEKQQILAIASDKAGKMHKDAGNVTIKRVPWWRPDLELPEDILEEIVRVVGYDRVPATLPSWRPRQLRFDHVRSKQRQVRDVLYGAGLFEVMTYSFVAADQLVALGYVAADHLKLKNPLSSEQAYLRSSLLASHLQVLSRNRTYAKELGFYEVAKVFVKKDQGEQPDEPLRLGLTWLGPELAYARLKGIVDALGWALNLGLMVEPATLPVYAPGRSGAVYLGKRRVGQIGELHPDRVRELKLEGEVAYAELDLAPLIEAATDRRFAGVQRFPTITRDVAVLVATNVTWQSVVDTLPGYTVSFVSDYYGDELPRGFKGLTLRLTLANPERTPTESEAEELEAAVLSRLERKLGAKRRA